MTHQTAQRLQEITDKMAQIQVELAATHGKNAGMHLAMEFLDLAHEQLDLYMLRELQYKNNLSVVTQPSWEGN